MKITIKKIEEFDDKFVHSSKGCKIFAGKTQLPDDVSAEFRKLKDKCNEDDAPLVHSLDFPGWTAGKTKEWLEDNDIKYDTKELTNVMDGASFDSFFIREPIENTEMNMVISGEQKEPPEWIQLLPLRDYYYEDYGLVRVSMLILTKLKESFDAISGYGVVDYEHSSIKSATAIAAGWITDMEIREGDSGLWGKIIWTPQAAQEIVNNQYRYGSIVYRVAYNGYGDMVKAVFHSHAITNTPNIQNMEPLMNSLKIKLNVVNSKTKERDNMLNKIRLALGLPETSTDEEVMLAVNSQKAIITEGEKNKTENEKSNEEMKKKLAELELINSSVAGIINKDNGTGKKEELTPDSLKLYIETNFVNKSELAESVKKLDDYRSGVELERMEILINDAIVKGKMDAKQKEWAVGLAKTNPEALVEFINNAPIPLPGSRISKDVPGGEINESGKRGVALLAAVKEIRLSNKCDFIEATRIALQKNPELGNY